MSRTISLITVIGAALVLAAPAFGQGERFVEAPQWQQALMARSDGLNEKHGLGEYNSAVQALKLRSEALNRQYGLGEYTQSNVNVLDARERAFAVRGQVESKSMLDAREEAFGTKRDVQLTATSGPDAFERTVVASTRGSIPVVADDRFRIDPTTNPVPGNVTSGREIEWPQVGIGLGIGILLALALGLAMRYTRIRPLAH
jgi:hypothetical protein